MKGWNLPIFQSTFVFPPHGCSKRSRVMASPYGTSRWHSDAPHFFRTPLDKWSARGRDLYMTTHSTHKRQTSMPPAGSEPTIPASERPQTHALDCAVTAIGSHLPLGLPIGIYCSSFPLKLRIHSWNLCVPHAQSMSSSLIVIVMIILREDYNSLSPSFCSFLQYPPQSIFFPLCGRPILRHRQIVKCEHHK